MSTPEHERLLKLITHSDGELELLAHEDGGFRIRVDRDGLAATSILLTDEEFSSLIEAAKASKEPDA
jgi:hypothetical protein